MSDATLTFRLARATRRLLGIDRERRWNTQYATGMWDGLRRLDEMAHHAVLAGYSTRLKPTGALLDVGCGDGLFHEHLNGQYGSYVGIDFEEPVRRASAKADARTRFIAVDMHEFTTGDRFDAIVFNESLYYHRDPMACLRRYEAMLTGDGVFLISMHRTQKSDAIWEQCDARYAVMDAVTITNAKGVTWSTKVLAQHAQ
jgi:2-polyprenyl-3-methyl-5-hydroxy-6-metoxy-1,4-benzoquinol methylase